MSMVSSARGGFEEAVVLDAFAGSGALGLEALSRGAERAVFCEMDRNALGPYNLVFLDPPYALAPEDVLAFLETLREAGALTPDVLVSYEHSTKTDAALDALLESSPWQSTTRRHWKDTSIDFLAL